MQLALPLIWTPTKEHTQDATTGISFYVVLYEQ